MPLVDRIHPVPARQWSKRPFALRTMREIVGLRRDLRASHYDLCIDVQGSIRSAVIGSMADARRFTGSLHPRESPAKWFYSRTVATRCPHVIEQACEIVSAAIRERLAPSRPLLPVDAAGEAWAVSLAENLPLKKIVVLAPGAGWGAKRWPARRFGLVAAGLAAHGYATLINVGPGEKSLAAPVVAASRGAAQPIECGIGQLASLLRRTSLFIGGDTGPLHLAAALQRPVVGIYGPTDSARNGPYWGIANRELENDGPTKRSRVLRQGAGAGDHTRRREPGIGLLSIPVEAVLDAALGLLQESPEPEHVLDDGVK